MLAYAEDERIVEYEVGTLRLRDVEVVTLGVRSRVKGQE